MIPRRGRPPQRFRLQRIRLVGFHNFIDETVEVRDGGHLFLLGDNGSGKTTVLDAVQYALSGGHDLELNAAARVGGRKDDGRTIQGVVLRYDAERGVRNTLGGIAYAVLELVDEEGLPLCLGVGTEAQTLDARVQRWGFLVRTGLEQVPLIRQDRTVVTRDELRERLGKEHVYGRVEDYRRAVAERLFGGPELYEEVCRFWGMAKAYREIVAGARDFGALFARLLPAPDPQVFGDILARLREIDGLEVNLREIDQQRLYVAGIVSLQDAVAQQREAAARYAWLLAARRREDAELAMARSRARAAELEAAVAAAEVAETEAEALLRVAELERQTAEGAEGARLEAALREAEARAGAAGARAHSARQDAANARAELRRAEAAAAQARAELSAALAFVAADLRRTIETVETRDTLEPFAGDAIGLPSLRAFAARLAQAATEVDQAEPGAVSLPRPAAEHARELEDAETSARGRRDAALSVSSRARAEVDAARGRLAVLETQAEEIPRIDGWLGLRAALAAEGLAAQPLYELLEPRTGASDATLAAVEALTGEAGLAMLLAPPADLERVRTLAAAHASAVRVQVELAADATLPVWIEDALAPGAPQARAALATWLSQAASLGVPPAPTGATLRHRGAAFEVTDARPRLLGQMARSAALRARVAEARAALAGAEQHATRATAGLAAADVALARLDRVAEALRAAGGATLATAHATTLAAGNTADRCRVLGSQVAARHDEAAQDDQRAAALLAALRARLDEQAAAELRAQLAALARGCVAARTRQREAAERVGSLRNELRGVRLDEAAQVRGLAERVAAQAAAGSALRARLLAPLEDGDGDDALSVYVRETRQGNRFRSTAAVEEALRAAERDEHGSATELAGDGSRGVRNAAYAPRFGFAYDRAANQVLGRHDQPARTVLAGIERDLAEQREVINSRTRELMDTLVMGSLARHLQEQIERLARMVREMNQLLAGIPFGAGTYEFQVTARPDRREAVELVRQVSLVDEESRRRFRTWIDERLPDLRAGEGEVPEILDYRRWFDYRLFVRSAGQDGVELTAARRRVGSGGEQGVPNYLLVLALGKLMFDNADARIRPLLFDEAFYGIDAGRRDQLLRFATELGIQLLVASPDQDGVTPAVRHATTLFVVKDAQGDVHLAPYHFWNHAGASQRGLFGDAEPAPLDPADAECRVAPPQPD